MLIPPASPDIRDSITRLFRDLGNYGRAQLTRSVSNGLKAPMQKRLF